MGEALALGFAVPGVLGLSAGIVGFVVGTIEKSVTAYDIVNNHASVLRIYHSQLRSLEIRLQAWNALWLGDATKSAQASEDSLVLLWGPLGVQQIKETKRWIDEEVRRIYKLLKSPYTASTDGKRVYGEWATWQTFLEHNAAKLKEGTRHNELLQVAENVSLGRKLAMPLGKASLLKMHLDALTTHVQYIERQAIDNYMKARGTVMDSNSKVTAEEREKLERTEKRTLELWTTMAKLHKEKLDSTKTWAIMFTNLSEPHKRDFALDDRLDINFFRMDTSQGHQDGHRVPAIYELDSDEDDDAGLGASLTSALRDKTTLDEGTFGENLKKIFHSFGELPSIEQQQCQTNMKYQFAKAALYTATWSTLLWDSRWVDELCTCRLHQVHLLAGDQIMAYQQKTAHVTGQCRALPGLHVHLGLVLAELALGCSVYLRKLGSLHKFEVSSGAQVEALNQDELLSRVQRKTNGRLYRDAVRFCFNHAVSSPLRRADTVRKFTDGVIRPLYLHLRKVQRQHDNNTEIYAESASLLQQRLHGSRQSCDDVIAEKEVPISNSTSKTSRPMDHITAQSTLENDSVTMAERCSSAKPQPIGNTLQRRREASIHPLQNVTEPQRRPETRTKTTTPDVVRGESSVNSGWRNKFHWPKIPKGGFQRMEVQEAAARRENGQHDEDIPSEALLA